MMRALFLFSLLFSGNASALTCTNPLSQYGPASTFLTGQIDCGTNWTVFSPADLTVYNAAITASASGGASGSVTAAQLAALQAQVDVLTANANTISAVSNPTAVDIGAAFSWGFGAVTLFSMFGYWISLGRKAINMV